MRGHLQRRLASIEQRCEEFRGLPCCDECGAPVPAAPISLFLKKDGTVGVDSRKPCASCGAPPGTHRAVDPQTGDPRDGKVRFILFDINWPRWVELYKASGRTYPAFYQVWIDRQLAAHEGAGRED